MVLEIIHILKDTFQSSTLPSSTGGWFQGLSESTIAEGKDGTIIVNMRNSYSGLDTAPCNCRGYAISTDGGETVGDLQYDHELYDPGVARGCQGSFIGIDLPGRGRELFFSNPHNKTSRVGLIVQVNNASGSGKVGIGCHIMHLARLSQLHILFSSSETRWGK